MALGISNEKYVILTIAIVLLNYATIQLIKPAVALTGIQTDNYPRSIVVATNLHRTYVANQLSDTISIIGNLGRTIHRIDTSVPTSMALFPIYGLVYVTNAKANTVSVIDGSTNKIV